jgi:hypothetical protein
MEPNDIVVLGITGGLSLFFLVSGIRGLFRGHITVVNPNSSCGWPGLLGLLLFISRRSMEIDNSFSPLTHTAKIEGAEAKGRAWFYILLGIACGCAAVLHFINVRS